VNLKLSRTHLSNKTLDIYSADCPEAWAKNTNKTSIYSANSFDYKFNSMGFRCDEFCLQSNVPTVYLGCSHTMGLGVPYNESWAYKLHQRLSPLDPFWNLAFEKSSIDAQVLMLNEYVNELQPKRIFFLMPNLYRRYITYGNSMLHYSPMLGQDKKFFDPKNTYETFNIDSLEPTLLDQSYAFSQVDLYLTMLDLIASKYNATVFLQHWYLTKTEEKLMLDTLIAKFSNIVKLDTEWEIKDWARDKMHFGPDSHSLFADRLSNELSRLLHRLR
jgi:hypothetical protein